LPGIDPKTANDQVETGDDKRNAKDHEKPWSTYHNYHRFPKDRKAAPEDAEGDQEGVCGAQTHTLRRLP
jgi:hypothetical protein